MTDVEIRKGPVEPDANGYGGPEHIQSAWRRLAGGAQIAANALIDVAQNSDSDLARVQASQAILNRVGLQTNTDINVRVIPSEYDPIGPADSHISPTVLIRERLNALRAASQETGEDEDGIVDAVIVEE